MAGVAALAAVGGGAAWAAGRSNDDDALKTLKVPEGAVTAQSSLEKMESYEDAVTLAGSAKLPFGTLVWCSDDAVAACLLPTETAKPLAEVGLLDLVSAECTTILEHAVGEAEGFEIYDVRANAAGVIWTEADILDSLWRVYAAPLSGTTLGEPQLLDEGDVNWEMPTLAVAGAFAFWQRLPQLDGNARVEDSLLKRAAFGTANVQMVYASQGRMACAPTSCGDSLTLAPRARTSGTYYQLTHLDAATGEVTDACVLPSSMRPMECSWGKTGFSFAFDGIYNYGEGIANLGTYLPMEAPEAVSLTAANAEETAAETDEADDAAPYLPVACANPGTEAYSDGTLVPFRGEPAFRTAAGAATGSWCAAAASWWPSIWRDGAMRNCPSRRGRATTTISSPRRTWARGPSLIATWTTPPSAASSRSTASSAFGNRRRRGALACPRSGREGSREDLCALYPPEERGR